MTRNNAANAVATLASRAGIERRMTPHTLRHAAITAALRDAQDRASALWREARSPGLAAGAGDPSVAVGAADGAVSATVTPFGSETTLVHTRRW